MMMTFLVGGILLDGFAERRLERPGKCRRRLFQTALFRGVCHVSH